MVTFVYICAIIKPGTGKLKYVCKLVICKKHVALCITSQLLPCTYILTWVKLFKVLLAFPNPSLLNGSYTDFI